MIDMTKAKQALAAQKRKARESKGKAVSGYTVKPKKPSSSPLN